jgi:hypothetical protein
MPTSEITRHYEWLIHTRAVAYITAGRPLHATQWIKNSHAALHVLGFSRLCYQHDENSIAINAYHNTKHLQLGTTNKTRNLLKADVNLVHVQRSIQTTSEHPETTKSLRGVHGHRLNVLVHPPLLDPPSRQQSCTQRTDPTGSLLAVRAILQR